MKASLVYDGEFHLPPEMGTPREDQLQGTPQENLGEAAGRICYDSLGTGRGSKEYFHNLLFVQKHYSVAEHIHVTVETGLIPFIWLGIPDVVVTVVEMTGKTRITFNLRHVLEWPSNVTFKSRNRDQSESIRLWGHLMNEVAHHICPNIFLKPLRDSNIDGQIQGYAGWNIYDPEDEREAYISVFLEDSRVWSHEQVRHRGNISQRSGRFVDETDRPDCIHPLLRDYLNDLGFLPHEGVEASTVFQGSDLDDEEKRKRLQIGQAIGSHQVQAKMIYKAVVDNLQPYAAEKFGLDKVTARKQARSAGRYALLNSLSTEMIFTASIRHWNHIFKMRCSPHADAAIRELMDQCREVVKGSRYGHMVKD